MSFGFGQWLMRRSLRQLGGLGVAGSMAIIGGAIGLRQRHLRTTPVVIAAEQQIKAADSVRALLGSAVASTSGVVGGYTDPVGGTACITLPVMSETGVRAVARVEAEAEWLVVSAQAEARGEAPPAPAKSESCRWLLRHLEVELEAPPAAANASASAHAITLYSLPRNAALSPWAPSREPSAMPRWLRALLPEPSAVAQAEATPRLLFVGAAAVSAHALVFARLHRRMITEQMLRRAESMLNLPETAGGVHDALARRAFELAIEASGPEGAQRVVRSSGAPLYGHADATRVLAFTSLKNQSELFFKAERSAAAASRPHAKPAARGVQQRPSGEQWTVVQIAMAPTEAYSRRLATLPADANETALLETMLSVEMQPLELGMLDRQVVVPTRSRR